MLDVEIARRGDHALEAYKQLFELRYGRPPIISNALADQTTLRDLVRAHGYNEVLQLLNQYFKMEGAKGWFVTKAHDIRTFRDSLNQVSVALPRLRNTNKSVEDIGGKGPKILIPDFTCDNWDCRKRFDLVCHSTYLDKVVLCPDCRRKGTYKLPPPRAEYSEVALTLAELPNEEDGTEIGNG